jgi:RimK family alpha-L-glutamate ligase
MHLAILSTGNGWHVADLVRAAAARGHHARPVDFRRLAAGVACTSSGRAEQVHVPEPLAGFDAVLVRTMPPGSLEQVVFRMDVLHRLEARGVPVFNPARSLEICVDKYLATARLEAAGLRVPATVACQDAETAMAAFAALGGDVVVKPLFGSEGRGLVRVADAELAWRSFRTVERLQAVIYLQQFIRHPGWDLRVFVLAGRVLAAMRRFARDGWRTNVAQGGRAEKATPDAAAGRLALAAADAVGVIAGGVDLLPGPGGEWYVLEVNAVPGWRALAPVTGVDVAAEVIRAATVRER